MASETLTGEPREVPHVLIVEDDRSNADLMTTILTRIGEMAVTVSEDADEVLSLCQEGKVQVVLMDVSLSNTEYKGRPIDGLELTRLLKSDPTTAGIPVILVTAHAMKGDQERFLRESGAEGYVTKPLPDHHEFVRIVESFLPDSGG